MKKAIKYFFLFGTIIFGQLPLKGQLVNPYYADGDKVAFVGNSITRNGEFYAIISLYQATRFPHQKVRFYNCGISGNYASDVLKRYNSDVMEFMPNKVSVMLGMNDVGRQNYYESLLVNGSFPASVISIQQNSKSNYVTNMTNLISKFKSNGCKVVIQSTTIYDEDIVPTAPMEPNSKVNSALGDFSQLCNSWSNDPSNNFPFVNYYSELNRINTQEKVSNTTFSFMPADRIHPETLGHFVMACTYLKALGMPAIVSNVEVSVGNSNALKSDNALVNAVSLTADGGTFKVFAKSLPMPIISGTEKALSWTYFDYYNELNSEILKINGLNSTQQYGLLIGGAPVANFTGTEFANGINLAKYTTPQSMQSEKIKQLIYQKRSIEWKIRQMRLMESFLSTYEMDNLTVTEKLNAVASRSSETAVKKSEYALERPKEPDYRQQIISIENDIFALQITKEYVYSITTPIQVIDYNKSDVLQLISFLTQPSTVAGKNNADILGITNLQDPSTWPNSGTDASKVWVWDTNSPKKFFRLYLGKITDTTVKSQLSGDISFSPASGNLAGLDISGCSNINSFELTGASGGPYSTLFDNCTNLTKINLSNKTGPFTYLMIRNCTKLRAFAFNSGAFTSTDTQMQFDISNNPLLSKITKVNIAVTTIKTDKTLYPDAFIRFKNNALRFSQFPFISSFKTKSLTTDSILINGLNPFILENQYNYSTQRHEVAMDEIVDLSKEVSVSLNNVTFNTSSISWYNSSTNVQVFPVELVSGIFKLSGSGFSVGNSYFANIANSSFSSFGLAEIKSAPFYIKELTSTVIPKEKSLLIYPNPFKNSINLLNFTRIKKVDIYNIVGNLLLTQIPTTATINLSFLPTGNYIVKCFTADAVSTQNIIKL